MKGKGGGQPGDSPRTGRLFPVLFHLLHLSYVPRRAYGRPGADFSNRFH